MGVRAPAPARKEATVPLLLGRGSARSSRRASLGRARPACPPPGTAPAPAPEPGAEAVVPEPARKKRERDRASRPLPPRRPLAPPPLGGCCRARCCGCRGGCGGCRCGFSCGCGRSRGCAPTGGLTVPPRARPAPASPLALGQLDWGESASAAEDQPDSDADAAGEEEAEEAPEAGRVKKGLEPALLCGPALSESLYRSPLTPLPFSDSSSFSSSCSSP